MFHFQDSKQTAEVAQLLYCLFTLSHNAETFVSSVAIGSVHATRKRLQIYNLAQKVVC